MATTKTVEVSNRTRAGVAVNFPKPVEVTISGSVTKTDSVILPRTPKGEYSAPSVIFAESDWKDAMKLRAVQGLVETGQIEAR